MAKRPTSDGAAESGPKIDDRRARQAAALRENLRKRKEQRRARAAEPPPHPKGYGGPDA